MTPAAKILGEFCYLSSVTFSAWAPGENSDDGNYEPVEGAPEEWRSFLVHCGVRMGRGQGQEGRSRHDRADDLREHRGGSARRPRYRRLNTRLSSCRWLRAGDAEAERNGAVVFSAG